MSRPAGSGPASSPTSAWGDDHDGTAPPIVVGVDGSEPSLRALDWAADEAALRGTPHRLVHASLWERYEGALLAQQPGKPLEEVMARARSTCGGRRWPLRSGS